MIDALPMGTVTVARTACLARNTPGVRLEIRVSDYGDVTIYSPVHSGPVFLQKGAHFYFDVGVRQESARDFIFEAATYVLRPDKGEQDGTSISEAP